MTGSGGEAVPNASVAAPPRLSMGALRRRILRGSAWVLGGRIVTTVLGFLINALLARILNLNELGAFFTSYTLVVVGGIIAQLGLDRAVVRFVPSSLGTGRPGAARSAIRTVLGFGTLGSLVTAIVVLAGGGWVARTFYHSPVLAAAIPVTAGWLGVSAIQSLFVETWRAFQRFDLATIFDQLLVDVLSVGVFAAFYVAHAHPGLSRVLLLSLGFSAIATLVAGVALLPRVRRLPRQGRTSGREILDMAWPALVTNTAIYVLGTGVDVLVLGAFRPQHDVAIYGAAARLMMLVSTPYLILQGVTPPIISELWAQGRKSELERALRSVSTLAGLPALLVLLVFVFFGGPALGLAFGPDFRQGAAILAVLSAGRVVAVSCGSSGITLMMTGHQRELMTVTIATGICSLAGEVLLAPHFGGLGVACSTAAVAAVQNVAMYYLAKRLTGIRTVAEFSVGPFAEFLFGRRRAA